MARTRRNKDAQKQDHADAAAPVERLTFCDETSECLFPEGEEMSPRVEPRPVAEVLANVNPAIMEEINAMSLAINTHTGEVLNWATNQRTTLEKLVEELSEAAEAKSEPPVRRWWWVRAWRWMRGIRE